MRRIYCLLLFLYLQVYFSQNTIVEFAVFTDSDEKAFLNEFLLITPSKESFYMTNSNYDFSSKNALRGTLEDKNAKITTFIKSTDKSILEFKWKVPELQCLIEDRLMYKWTISDETKEILGYKCYKAKTKFRGREWTVYFTYEIQVNAGPWKFKDLPGLILEAEDSEKQFKFVANKIILNSKVEIPDTILNFFENNKNKFVDYKFYIDKENAMFKDIDSRLAANRPKGLVLKEEFGIRDCDIERSFEWENDSKKP